MAESHLRPHLRISTVGSSPVQAGQAAAVLADFLVRERIAQEGRSAEAVVRQDDPVLLPQMVGTHTTQRTLLARLLSSLAGTPSQSGR